MYLVAVQQKPANFCQYLNPPWRKWLARWAIYNTTTVMGLSPIHGGAFFVERAETLQISIDFAIKVGLWLRLRKEVPECILHHFPVLKPENPIVN